MTALGTRLLKVKINGTDYTGAVTEGKFTSGAADASMQTMSAVSKGGARAYTFTFTAQQDPGDTTSIWSLMFATATVGTTVPIIFNPYGVTTATATTPFTSANVVITEPDGDYIGGVVDSSVNKRQVFSCVWECDAKPTLVTTGSF